MQNIFHITGEVGPETVFLGTITLSQFFSALSTIVFISGVAILISWLIRNKGFSALDSAPVRLNKMRLRTPLLQLFIWIILVMLSGSLIRQRFGEPLPIQGQYALYISLLAVELGMICSVMVIVSLNFQGRIKGFGLDFKTLPKDLGWALVNYIAAMPLIMISVWVIIYLGKLVAGADFALPKNQSLELLMQVHVTLKIILILSAAFIVPIFEELLFRGLIQSTLRTHLGSPWLAIIFTSVVFVAMHGIWLHWLPLMALSVCMGYAYEKSGSILRPICIHIAFNTVSIIGALLT